jgi:hypothetical protein
MTGRLRAAWLVLRHGVPPAPPPDVTLVDADELAVLIQFAAFRAGLPPQWPERATSEELRTAAAVVAAQRSVRDQTFDAIEAGHWPALTSTDGGA